MVFFKVFKKDRKTRARFGKIVVPAGEILTPAFAPVATRASVRALSPDDLKAAKTQVILANTYHLFLRPGVDVIKQFGGFAHFMKWDGPTITDSGGYQVSFLWQRGRNKQKGKVVKITDEGVVFASHIDGRRYRLTPELSMQIQKILGADIIMAFDQPLSMDESPAKQKEAFLRTMLWEKRSYLEWRKLGTQQMLFGIIQGEIDKSMRRQSLSFLLEYDFPGLAIGGASIGSNPTLIAKALDTIVDLLPDDKPLHALGLGGGPEGIFNAVERGVDIFDNTGVTRMARTGLLFIYPEDGGTRLNKFRFNIKRQQFASDRKPLSKICHCIVCQNYSRAYIHHLLVTGELLGFRLATIHNLCFVNHFLYTIRKAIMNGDFLDMESEWLGAQV